MTMPTSEALAPLDTVFTVDTPEGVALRLELAGPWIRSAAWMLDFALRVVLTVAIATPLTWLGGAGRAVWLLALFGLEWLYPVCFEALTGATPGKRWLGLEVVRENGAPLDWPAALIRNLLRAADFLPFCNTLGLVCILVHPRLQRIGDMAAGTLVVYKPKRPDRERIPERPPLAPKYPLTVSEQGLVLEFCSRREELPPQRAKELAGLLFRLLPKEDSEEQLLRLGNFFLRGGRNAGAEPAVHGKSAR